MQLDKKAIGMRVSEIRRSMGLTLEEFGKLIDGAGKSAVSKWERGLTLPNNKRLKIIASIAEIPVFRLMYGSGINYIFDNYEKIMPDNYSKIKDIIPSDSLFYLGERIESQISNPTDFEGIRRVIDVEFPKIEKEIISNIDSFLNRISQNKNYKEVVIEKILNETDVYDNQKDQLSVIFEKCNSLTFEEKIKNLSIIEEIASQLSIVTNNEVFYTDTYAYVLKENELIKRKNASNLINDDDFHKEFVGYRKSSKPMPLKYKHFEILIRTAKENKCDLISNSSDILVYYFPNFKHEFLKKYFTNSNMVILINNELYLGYIYEENVFTTKKDGHVITVNLDNHNENIFFFPPLAVFYY